MKLASINPFSGQVIKEYEQLNDDEIMIKVNDAQKAFYNWKDTNFSERKYALKKVSHTLLDNINEYSRLMAIEMGKPIQDGRAEIKKCAWVCDYYAGQAEEMLNSEIVNTDADKSFVTFQPLGVILAIMPWNYPFWQVFRFAAPVLMAGNVALLKHSSNVSGCALAIEEIFKFIDIKEKIFQTLLCQSETIDKIIENPIIKGVALTGSKPAGQASIFKGRAFA